MKYLFLTLLFLANTTIAFDRLIEPISISVFKNKTLNEIGFKGYELLLSYDLAFEESVYKWQLEDPKKSDKSYEEQVKNSLAAIYVDGTKVSGLFHHDLEDIQVAVKRLYFERRGDSLANKNWSLKGLNKFSAHLFVKMSDLENIELLQLEGIYGSFATMSGIGVIDLKTHQVLLILSGISE